MKGDIMKDRIKRWKDAAERYRIATEIGVYNPRQEPKQRRRGDIRALEELLKSFFSWKSLEWEAVSDMLKCSGEEIELIRWDKQPFLVRLVIDQNGFRVVRDMGLPLELGRTTTPSNATESLWYSTVATLLVDHLLPRLQNVENIMQFLIEKIDEVADNAPDEP